MCVYRYVYLYLYVCVCLYNTGCEEEPTQTGDSYENSAKISSQKTKMLLGTGIIYSPRKGLVKQQSREGTQKLSFQSQGVAGEGSQNRAGCQVECRAVERQAGEYFHEQLV